MRFSKCFLQAVVMFVMLWSAGALGFSIDPMFLDMMPHGGRSRSSITVANSSPHPMPVRASVSELLIDSNGKTQAKPAVGSFVIFPPQAIVKPHGKQTFRDEMVSSPLVGITVPELDFTIQLNRRKDHG